MNDRRQFMIAMLSFCFALLSTPLIGTAASGSGKNDQEIRIEGTLVGVNLTLSNVSIRNSKGVVIVVAVNANTKVERNGVRVTIAAFKMGDRAQARISRATGLTTKVEAVGP